MRGERIQIPQKRAVKGPSAKLQFLDLVALESFNEKNSLTYRGIAMDFTGVGGGGGSVPQSSLASLDPRMHEDYAFVCVC